MMLQCTRQENIDALAAQLWIDSLPPQLRKAPAFRDHIHKLIARYGPIFEPRTLLCPRCLKVKYGNHPETVRQGWRRRHKKPDTRVGPNLDRIEVPLNHWSRYELEFVRMKRERKTRRHAASRHVLVPD